MELCNCQFNGRNVLKTGAEQSGRSLLGGLSPACQLAGDLPLTVQFHCRALINRAKNNSLAITVAKLLFTGRTNVLQSLMGEAARMDSDGEHLREFAMDKLRKNPPRGGWAGCIE